MPAHNMNVDHLNLFSHFYLNLKNYFFMPSTMTLQVNRYWHAGYMTGENLSMHCQRSNPATNSLRSDTQIVNSLQNFLF
jgi:hypothetical protein